MILEIFRDITRKPKGFKLGAQFSPWLVQPEGVAPFEAVDQIVLQFYCGKHIKGMNEQDFHKALDILVERGTLIRGTAENLFPNTFYGVPHRPVICSPRFVEWLSLGRRGGWEITPGTVQRIVGQRGKVMGRKKIEK